MPTYEYHCRKCGKDFEVFQSMKDEPFKTCPEGSCQVTPWGHGEVKRLLGTGAGLIFKGSGFYITDYRSEGYKQAAKKDSGTGGGDAKPKDKPASSPGTGSSGGTAGGAGSTSSSTGGSK